LLARHPAEIRQTARAENPAAASVRKLSFAFLCPLARDGEAGRAALNRMRAGVPGLATALDLADELTGMIRKTVIRNLCRSSSPRWATAVPTT
jgi:hypothetical protein